MREYHTYIFKRSRNKTLRRFLYNLFIVGAIGLVLYLFFVGIIGIGLSIFGAISLIVALIQMKKYDDRYMGITAYGDRKEKLVISDEYFKINETLIPLSELQDLVIYVDEYAGMPRNIFGIHHGGNNEIQFRHKGTKFNINYIIKNKSDFRFVEALVEEIERAQRSAL